MILVHYSIVRPVAELFTLTGKTYACGAALAFIGTIAPSYLLGSGLKRAGAQRFAIIGTVGPVATIVLAWAILGESLHTWQVAGFLLCMAGGLGVSLVREKPEPAPSSTGVAPGEPKP